VGVRDDGWMLSAPSSREIDQLLRDPRVVLRRRLVGNTSGKRPKEE
jgi:hypothetical protein